MSTAAAVLTIVQTASVLQELVAQYRRGDITQAQLVMRWGAMQNSLKAVNETWEEMEAKERDIGSRDPVSA